jgi:hypothetical protein
MMRVIKVTLLKPGLRYIFSFSSMEKSRRRGLFELFLMAWFGIRQEQTPLLVAGRLFCLRGKFLEKTAEAVYTPTDLLHDYLGKI